MEFKGTKGKWFACCNKTTPHFLFDEHGNTCIASFVKYQEMRDDLSDEEFRANALLISKAPEMLQMLINIKEHLNNDDKWSVEQLIKQATEL